MGEALWKSVALESILYGIQIISVTKDIMSKLDSIQCNFAADLIGVSRSSSHVGLLRELGWSPISSLVKKRKLLYWARLCGLHEDMWAKKTWNNCQAALHPQSKSWRSNYRVETLNLFTESKIGNVLKDNRKPENNIKLAIDDLEKDEMGKFLSDHRAYSLQYLPNYPDGLGRQKYFNFSDSSMLA